MRKTMGSKKQRIHYSYEKVQNLRAMCPKKRSISDYISLTKLPHTNKNSEIGQTMNAPKEPKLPHKMLTLTPN